MINLNNIKLFTHDDLDGVGCGIVLKLLYPNSNIDIEVCTYNNIDYRINEFISKLNQTKINYDAIYISDLSISNSTTINMLYDLYEKELFYDIKIIDHHISSEHLCDFPFTLIDLSENKSATKLIYEYMINNYPNTNYENKALIDFVESVSDYDTWKWLDKNPFAEELNLNFLNKLKVMSHIKYIEYMEHLLSSNILIENTDYKKIKDVISLRDKMINKKNQELFKYSFDSYNIGVSFVNSRDSKHRSILGYMLCKLNPDIDFVTIVNLDKGGLSFRTTNNQIDLNQFAKNYGGGGHIHASGATIQDFSNISRLVNLKMLKNIYCSGKYSNLETLHFHHIKSQTKKICDYIFL